MLKTKQQEGISIFLAMMIMAMLLSVALGISTIFLGRIGSLAGVGTSVMAFYGAETGIEKALYEDIKNCINELPEDRFTCVATNFPPGANLSNGASYTLELEMPGGNCTGGIYCVKSTGTYKDSQRAIRIAR